MPGTLRCVSVNFPKLRRGCDGETKSVCDPQLVRCREENSQRNLRCGILGEAGTSAAGGSFAACLGQRRADLPADRESQRGITECGAEAAHRVESSGGV